MTEAPCPGGGRQVVSGDLADDRVLLVEHEDGVVGIDGAQIDAHRVDRVAGRIAGEIEHRLAARADASNFVVSPAGAAATFGTLAAVGDGP